MLIRCEGNRGVPIETLDHYSVRTNNLAQSIAFYANVLGFVCGPRPAFPFPGAWLYRTDGDGKQVGGSVVHLLAMDGGNDGGLDGFLGNKDHHAEDGTGRLDHIAFRASGLAAQYKLLREIGVPFNERRVPDMQLHLLFVEDPCGVTIELNYTSDADLAACQM